MKSERAAYVPNPVFGGLLGICPLVAAANSLVNGFVLGAGAALSVAVLVAFLPLIQGFVPDRLRAPASLALAAGLALLVAAGVEALSPAVARALGVYLPLIAVSCVSLHALRRAPAATDLMRGESTGAFGAGSLLVEAALYFGAATFIGAVRELAGSGTLSFPMPGSQAFLFSLGDSSPARLFAAPAGGFLVLGCLAAAYRAILRARKRSA